MLREAEMLALLGSGEYPSRNPQQNLADLKAQIAANEKGVQELRRMVQQFGLRRCVPTWAMCGTTPKSRCAAPSRAWRHG